MRPHILPISPDDPAAADPKLDDLIEFVGYRPNALLTMARKPGLLDAVLQLVQVVLRGQGVLDLPMRFLLACEASRKAQCPYTAAHVVHAGHHVGLSWSKLDALDQYPLSPEFTDRERAALEVASAGGMLPVTGADKALSKAKEYFNEAECLEIVAVVALFGWFHRWNSLLGTALEEVPAEALHQVRWLNQIRREF